MSRLPIRLRLTLTSVALLITVLAAVLGASWVLLRRHLERTVPAEYVDGVLAQLGTQYALALAGAGLVTLGLGWWAAGAALSPLRRIAQTARQVGDERLDARVGMSSAPDDEVRELATAFDAMLDRVAGSVAAQQRFVANASHELRTPLTVIRTTAEVALDDPDTGVEELRAVAREAVATTERTEELLDGLLVLAAVGAGAVREAPVDLAEVARRAVEAARGEADAARIAVHATLAPSPLRGDAALLERLVGNLVENAIRHGAGRVEVAAAPRDGRGQTGDQRDPGGAWLRVVSGGPPIAPEVLARLTQPFERGHRAGRARGTGLGLSIVRAVAEAHGGTLRLSAPPSGGLAAEVALPAAPSVV